MYVFKNFVSAGKMGDDFETKTIQWYQNNGWEVIPATLEENKYDHIDIKCSITDDFGNKYFETVDIKADKKKWRSDNTKNDVLWIELINSYGYGGWIYSKADYICFWKNEKMYFINPINLREFILLKMYFQTDHIKYKQLLKLVENKKMTENILKQVQLINGEFNQQLIKGKRPNNPYEIYTRYAPNVPFNKEEIIYIPFSDLLKLNPLIREEKNI